jgi:hypothetical protein
MQKNDQVLKSRDDKVPVRFAEVSDAGDGLESFNLAEGSACSWAKQGESFGVANLRERIEPWLTELPDSGSGGLFMTRFEKVVLVLMLLQVALQVLSLFCR